MRGEDKGKRPGRMFGPVEGLGKRFAIINGNKFYTVENLFQGIQERTEMMTAENKRIGQMAYEEAVKKGKELLYDPETVQAAASATQVESKVVTNETIQEIVRDMQSGAIVEEVEYDDIETNITEQGVEDVIYVGGKTRSIFTPKKNKDKVWRVFWDRIKSINEEEEEGGDPTKGTLDQEDIIFGTDMEEDQESEAVGGRNGEVDQLFEEPEEDQELETPGDRYWEADQLSEEPKGNQQGWGGNTVGDRGWNEEEERRGRGGKKLETPPPRRVTSEGSPNPTPAPKKKRTESGAQKKERRTRGTTKGMGDEIVLGTASNPVRVRKVSMLEYGDKVETPVKSTTKDGGDDDKGHPWELDTSIIHEPGDSSDVECDMGEAPPANALEMRPALATTPNISKHASADPKHATGAPVMKMNDSKHAPAELKPAQRAAAEVVDNQYAEGNDRREEEASNTTMGNCDNKDNKDAGVREEERRNNVWDDIMGQPSWREKDEEPQIHMWFNAVRNMIGEVTAVKERRNVGPGKMEPGQGRRLWDKCQEVVALMVNMMKLMAESNLETDWKDVNRTQRAAILEWVRQKDENEERNIRKELLEPIAQGVCALVAEKPGASLKQIRLAAQYKKKAEEERKAEEKKRMADKGMSAARKGIAKMEREKKAEEEGVAKARAYEQQNEARLKFLDEKLDIASQKMNKAEGDEKLKLVEEIGKIGEEIKACRTSTANFSGKTRQVINGIEFKSGRMIATVDSTVKGGEAARGEIRTKTNELLKDISRTDGATPFAEIDKVEERVGWNGEKEIVLTMSKVNKQETVARIREVMVAQLNAVCGNGVLRAHREPAFPASIIVRGVPEGLEGSELVQAIRSENPGVNITPRWPHRYPNSKTVRLEVESPVEAEKVAKAKKVIIRGESKEAAAYDPERGQRNRPAPTSSKGMISSYANAARPTTTGGWTSTGRKAPMPGVLTCYTCKGVGHPALECPNKKAKKGTSIFAKHGCFNCGKEGHYADRCPSPRKFCSQCNVLGHVLSECWVANAIRRQAEKEKNKKREGETLEHQNRTPRPPILTSPLGMKDRVTNVRLEETSGSTPKSVSEANGTLAPPLAPRVPAPR